MSRLCQTNSAQNYAWLRPAQRHCPMRANSSQGRRLTAFSADNCLQCCVEVDAALNEEWVCAITTSYQWRGAQESLRIQVGTGPPASPRSVLVCPSLQPPARSDGSLPGCPHYVDAQSDKPVTAVRRVRSAYRPIKPPANRANPCTDQHARLQRLEPDLRDDFTPVCKVFLNQAGKGLGGLAMGFQSQSLHALTHFG